MWKFHNPFLRTFRIIISHFQLSCKSLAILTKSLEALEMRPLHLMLFCPTPMSYFLTACKQAVNLLLSTCDVLASDDVKPHERVTFIPLNQWFFARRFTEKVDKNYLRPLGGETRLIIDCYQYKPSNIPMNGLNCVFLSNVTFCLQFLSVVSF